VSIKPAAAQDASHGTWLTSVLSSLSSTIKAIVQQALLFGDLPLNFHPLAIRVSADVTPFGAG
jgi:hypothetical protein